MPVLLTADLHLTDNPRDRYRHDFMAKTLPNMVQKYNVQQLYVLGDLTEVKDNLGAELVNSIAGYFKALARLMPGGVFIICGNHDYARAAHPFFAFLRHLRNVIWVGKPTEFGEWLLLPHTNDYKKDWKISFKDYKKVFCHQTFAGAKVGARSMDGIPIDIFPRGVKVYSGDVHVPQHFRPITYIGAPYTVDFGDDYKPRVILLRDDTEESYRVPGPQKRLLDIKIGDKLPAFDAADIIKVRVAVTARAMDSWPKEKERIRAWAARGNYELWALQPTLDPADRARMRTAIRVSDHHQSDIELIASYAKLGRLSDRMLKTGLWLMEQQEQ